MYGYLGLCNTVYGYFGLCSTFYGYLHLYSTAVYDYLALCPGAVSQCMAILGLRSAVQGYL